MARRIRIAASVFFGLLTVALCVLWVRSYWRVYSVVLPFSNVHQLIVMSSPGVIYFSFDSSGDQHNWDAFTLSVDESASEYWAKWPKWRWLLYARPGEANRDLAIFVATWFPILLSFALTICTWLPFRRFSLRTLLIATTLVAVALGLEVWLES
ncbi:MAG: hypothetical protein AB7G28_25845 [Pirellulales bacterium]